MSAPLAGKFQDHYEVLGIEPKADSETIHKAYAGLIAKCHPKTGQKPDQERFDAVTLAYEVLSDPPARATFDALRSGPEKEPPPRFTGQAFFETVRAEPALRKAILCLLYDRMHQKPTVPSLSIRQLEGILVAPTDVVLRSVWYLKQKGWVLSDDKSNLQINVAGIDYLEDNLPGPDIVAAQLKPPDEPATDSVRAAASAPQPAPRPIESAKKTVEASPAPPPQPAPAPVPAKAAPSPPPRRIIVPPRA